ncbi:hypothetical protein [Bacillus mojavensis]|nr:hypothetical protein [Bacillus mojavensis]MEC1622781.1 hypothetical protein [Bacillus mojavensis]MEC1659284.1 hypothetical protein [Bacillus mojavensis]
MSDLLITNYSSVFFII